MQHTSNQAETKGNKRPAPRVGPPHPSPNPSLDVVPQLESLQLGAGLRWANPPTGLSSDRVASVETIFTFSVPMSHEESAPTLPLGSTLLLAAGIT